MRMEEMTKVPRIRAFPRKLEVLGTVVILYAITMHVLNTAAPAVLLTIGLSAMAIVYFMSGFRILATENKFISFIFFKLNGLGLALAYISILLNQNHWLSAGIWLLLPILIIMLSLILGLRYRNDENSHQIDKFFFMRLTIALTLACYIYFNI
jgi:hypothetical protein